MSSQYFMNLQKALSFHTQNIVTEMYKLAKGISQLIMRGISQTCWFYKSDRHCCYQVFSQGVKRYFVFCIQ